MKYSDLYGDELRYKLRNKMCYRSNPKNYWHYSYQNFCDRFFTLLILVITMSASLMNYGFGGTFDKFIGPLAIGIILGFAAILVAWAVAIIAKEIYDWILDK